MLDRKSFSLVRSLNLGALAGLAVAALLYECYPALFQGLTDRTSFILYGAAVGGAVTQTIRRSVSPLFKLLFDYGRILEAHIFLRAGLIDNQKFGELMSHLVDCHFGMLTKQQGLQANESGETNQ
jgi:hypothetical protein